jgi:hypothetical protein
MTCLCHQSAKRNTIEAKVALRDEQLLQDEQHLHPLDFNMISDMDVCV